jgi:hypothetical protein
MRGGMEAVYDDMVRDIGFLRFAPQVPARGAMFSARSRLRPPGQRTMPSPMSESD